jgi:single-strand DNA-binding protein
MLCNLLFSIYNNIFFNKNVYLKGDLAMNKVILIGRLTDNPTLRVTNGENPYSIARYRIAVNRTGKKEEADFISCITFRKNAEFAEKYLKKGMKIGIVGRITTGSYEKDGQKHYTTDIVVEEHEFCEKKGENGTETCNNQNQDGFIPIPEDLEDLPFA